MIDANIAIQIGSLTATLVTGLILGTRYLTNMEVRLGEKIAEARKEIDDRIERQYREFGESLQAIRQKITDVELYGRDTYVRRDSFQKVQEQSTAEMRLLGEKIDVRLDRVETKIDLARKTQMGSD